MRVPHISSIGLGSPSCSDSPPTSRLLASSQASYPQLFLSCPPPLFLAFYNTTSSSMVSFRALLVGTFALGVPSVRATSTNSTSLEAPTAQSWHPDFTLIVSSTVIHSDCTPRLSAVINGTQPAPLLRWKEGQHVWVRVYNAMASENTTMHWHGLSQFGTPFSDGTPMASQVSPALGDKSSSLLTYVAVADSSWGLFRLR